jgi:tetratricopeptide (TPR) repeat protein
MSRNPAAHAALQASPAAARHATTRKTIGLSMIVKNESRVMRRCLDSVLPLLDYVLVSDTGSTDGTQDLVRAYLAEKSIPGEVIERPWRDFAHNRTEALDALRCVDWVDYVLVIDADEVLVLEEGFSPAAFKANLTHDLYDITTRYGTNVYLRPQIFSNRLPFLYKSALHEYLEAPKGVSRAIARGLFNRPSPDGARSQDKDKYIKDVATLRKAIKAERDPFLLSRYRFYLAQSLRDSGQFEEALTEYLTRSRMGYWIEEVFVSLYQAGLMMERLERPTDDTVAMFLRAHDALGNRAEALHAAARVLRKAKRYEEARYFAKVGLSLTPSANALFLDSTTYDYGLLDELQISAYWTGRYRESLEIGERLLREAKFPESQRRRIEVNVGFAREKVEGARVVASA